MQTSFWSPQARFADLLARAVGQAQEVQDLRGAIGQPPLLVPQDASRQERAPEPLAPLAGQGEEHVVPHRELVEEPEMLERPRHPQRHDLVRRPPGELVAAEAHAAGVRRHEAGDEVEDGGLPRPVRPDEAGDAPCATVNDTWSTAWSPPNALDSPATSK